MCRLLRREHYAIICAAVTITIATEETEIPRCILLGLLLDYEWVRLGPVSPPRESVMRCVHCR